MDGLEQTMAVREISLIGIRLFFSLILFFILIRCENRPQEKTDLTLIWKDSHPREVAISKHALASFTEISLGKLLTVHVKGPGDQPAILGEYLISTDSVKFRPLIPFTPGMTYELRWMGKLIREIKIPEPAHRNAPKIISVYPSQDTLPINLLKIFIRFSKPMQEGHALDYVTLIMNDRDTVHDVFLDLQPELWNADRTLLTLWLDPGRIKRDLQPNKKMGTPLQSGSHYTLIVNDSWMDSQGTKLEKQITKKFTTIPRDSISPDPEQWRIGIPSAGSSQDLQIDFGEPMDYSLILEAIHVVDESNQLVDAVLSTDYEESRLKITPKYAWRKGTYHLQYESRIEDVAGNNLNRPFDQDLRLKEVRKKQDLFVTKFTIR